MPYRILVADDHEIVRRGICALLAAQNGWEVCGEASDGRQAIAAVSAQNPDLVVLDVGMPNLNGLDATRRIAKNYPDVKILILTLHSSREVLRAALHSGAHGLLLKSDAAANLVTAITALQQGATYFHPKLVEIADLAPIDGPDSGASQLTSREREVVQLLAEGNTCRQVADALGLSVKTADTHRSKIMRKLNIHSVRDLVLFAIRHDIIQVGDPGTNGSSLDNDLRMGPGHGQREREAATPPAKLERPSNG